MDIDDFLKQVQPGGSKLNAYRDDIRALRVRKYQWSQIMMYLKSNGLEVKSMSSLIDWYDRQDWEASESLAAPAKSPAPDARPIATPKRTAPSRPAAPPPPQPAAKKKSFFGDDDAPHIEAWTRHLPEKNE